MLHLYCCIGQPRSKVTNMVHHIALHGRIDELETIPTLEALAQHLHQVLGGTVLEYTQQYAAMYQPLPGITLNAVYYVQGIEGIYFDGYVTGQLLVAGQFGPAVNNQPWPIHLRPGVTAYQLMLMVAASPYNGYPHVNHVWFEGLTVVPGCNLLSFGMGS